MLTTAEHLKRLPFKGYHAQYPFQYAWNFDVGGPDPIVDYPQVFTVEQAANNGYYYALDGALVLKNFDTVTNVFTAYPAFTVGGNLTPISWTEMRYNVASCIELILEATVSPALYFIDGYNYSLTIPESYFNANGSWQTGKNHIVFQQGALWLNGVLDTGLSLVNIGADYCRVSIYRNSYELTRDTKVWSVAFYNIGRWSYAYPQYGYPAWEPDPAYLGNGSYRYAIGSPTIPVPNPLRLELTP